MSDESNAPDHGASLFGILVTHGVAASASDDAALRRDLHGYVLRQVVGTELATRRETSRYLNRVIADLDKCKAVLHRLHEGFREAFVTDTTTGQQAAADATDTPEGRLEVRLSLTLVNDILGQINAALRPTGPEADAEGDDDAAVE